jgi:hypothetical protein
MQTNTNGAQSLIYHGVSAPPLSVYESTSWTSPSTGTTPSGTTNANYRSNFARPGKAIEDADFLLKP